MDCVPIEPLPRRLTSHFDGDSNLVRISGGGISTGCGVLMSGPAAIFHKVSVTCMLYLHAIRFLKNNFISRTDCATLSQ